MIPEGATWMRVNRFFGWQAVGKLALRQAPLSSPTHGPMTTMENTRVTIRIPVAIGLVLGENIRAMPTTRIAMNGHRKPIGPGSSRP